MAEDRSRIPDELAGQRLDQALARMFPEYSRSRLKAWLLDGAVIVDGSVLRPRDKVHGGELVELNAVAEAVVRAEPEPMALDIVFEDDALLVVNKQAGLVVHALHLDAAWPHTQRVFLANVDEAAAVGPKIGIFLQVFGPLECLPYIACYGLLLVCRGCYIRFQIYQLLFL